MSSTERRRREGGFTLVELLVALLLIAMIGALTAPVVPFGQNRLGLDRTLVSVRDALRHARAETIAKGGRRSVAFDIDERTVQRADGVEFALQNGIGLSVTGARSESEGGALRIAFLPDGSSTGGAVELSGEGSRASVTVDWLTGGIDAER